MNHQRGFFLPMGAAALLLVLTSPVFGAQPASSETAGGVLQRRVEQEKAKGLEQRLQKEGPKEKEQPIEEMKEGQGPTVLIREITVEDATLIPADVLRGITAPFEGKNLSMSQIQSIADKITAEYRKKGYVTSRAYVPPQSLSAGRLTIKVVEGKLGSLSIRGNKYFKTGLFEDYLDLKPHGYFDYSALQNSLVYINEHPDRTAKLILMPGKEPGTTDLVLDVKDRLPFHVGFEYDNYASRYLENDRYAWVLEHNNLLGFDDRLYIKGQYGEAGTFDLYQSRYTFPVNKTLDVGVYTFNVRTKLSKEFKGLDANGKAFLTGLFFDKKLIYRNDLEWRINGGFDYKDVINNLLGTEISHDELRVFKIGSDLDFTDRYGRNILTTELDVGVPDFMGAMAAKDRVASRAGAGGKFQKWLINYFRLHPMPWESYILWKNIAQVSNHNLVASEQFQIGGATSVRGYAPAEYSGDQGYYTALEWSFPFYGMPKDWRVPFREESLYDALKWVIFYDFAYAHVNHQIPGEQKNRTLKGYGLGVRLNVKDDAAIRVEVGFPGGDISSDGDRAHVWAECQLKL